MYSIRNRCLMGIGFAKSTLSLCLSIGCLHHFQKPKVNNSMLYAYVHIWYAVVQCLFCCIAAKTLWSPLHHQLISKLTRRHNNIQQCTANQCKVNVARTLAADFCIFRTKKATPLMFKVRKNANLPEKLVFLSHASSTMKI